MKALLIFGTVIFILVMIAITTPIVIGLTGNILSGEPVFVTSTQQQPQLTNYKDPAQIDAETSMRVAIDTNRTNNLIALSAAQMEIERQRAELNDARRLAIVNSAAPAVFAGMLIVAVLVIVVAVAAVKIMVDTEK